MAPGGSTLQNNGARNARCFTSVGASGSDCPKDHLGAGPNPCFTPTMYPVLHTQAVYDIHGEWAVAMTVALAVAVAVAVTVAVTVTMQRQWQWQ